MHSILAAFIAAFAVMGVGYVAHTPQNEFMKLVPANFMICAGYPAITFFVVLVTAKLWYA